MLITLSAFVSMKLAFGLGLVVSAAQLGLMAHLVQ